LALKLRREKREKGKKKKYLKNGTLKHIRDLIMTCVVSLENSGRDIFINTGRPPSMMG
jgi:hypothetical protein